MIDLAGLPLISQASDQSLDQAVAAVSSLQQDGSAIGTAIQLIELQHNWLSDNLREQQTLCCAIVGHAEAFLLASNTDLTPCLSQKRASASSLSRIIQAKAWGYVSHNPFEGLKLPKLNLPDRRVFTIEQVKQIIEAAEEPHKTFFWLAAETGMRIGELCGLRIEDVDCNIVRVRQSAWNGNLQTPKSDNAARVFAISPALAKRLEECIEAGGPRVLLFSTKNGKPWDSRYVVRLHLRPILDKLGIPRAGIHAFRHFSATQMDRLAVPLKAREARLGHSSAALTLGTYTHVVSADDERFAAQMGEILCPSLPQVAVSDTKENDNLPNSVGA